jgi:hypothetical protein
MTWWDWMFAAVVLMGIAEFGVLIWAIFFAQRTPPRK